ncbi:hypothetical protein SOPP22_13585 [Shewanella sp. OPT22]|nr:hypothetical protein SOPP22_13585 [Shewanella sp. OPT22]
MDKLFLGINNHVLCLNKANGEVIWKTKLKGSGITNVHYEEKRIYAYSGGHLFCLEAIDGRVVWTNSLKGMGYSACIIATENQNSSNVASQVAAQQAIAASVAAAGAVAASS